MSLKLKRLSPHFFHRTHRTTLHWLLGSAKKAEDDAAKNAASTATMVKSTINWSAPEILANGASFIFAEPSDVYSFACTVFEVITFEVPWASQQAWVIQKKVVGGERPSLDSIKLGGAGAQALQNIVEDCWQHDAEARPEMEKVLLRLEKLRAAHPVTRKDSLAAAAKAEELEELRRKLTEFEMMQKRMKEMEEENSRLRAANSGAGGGVLQGSAKAAAKEEREERPAATGSKKAAEREKKEGEEQKAKPATKGSHKATPANNHLEIPDSEFRALVDIYDRCGGKKWKKGNDWGSSKTSWTGVSVKDRHVVKLELRSFGLTGGKSSIFPASNVWSSDGPRVVSENPPRCAEPTSSLHRNAVHSISS